MVSKERKSKKQKVDECFIDRLPRDLIERIFLSLPADTLFICTAVSKNWKNIIWNPKFIALQLKHATRDALLFFPQETVWDKCYPSDVVLINDTWSKSTCSMPVIGPDDLLFGSCNGLVGIYTETSAIKIANFVTGECLYVEKPRTNLRAEHYLYNFGFHPVKEEYTITHFFDDHSEGYTPNNIIQVYKLGDENWRDIQAPADLISLHCMRSSGVVNLDGLMYWLTEVTVPNQNHVLVSFDLGEETFEQMQLPTGTEDDSEHGDTRRYWIREIQGEICVATAHTSIDQPRMLFGKLQIWTLNENMEQTWSQKYSIDCSYHYILGPYFGHVDKFMTQYVNYNIYSHEFLGQNFEIAENNMMDLLDCSPRMPDNVQCFTCVRSLIRLDSYKNSAIVCRPRQKEGWKLKRWEAWEQELCSLKNVRRNIFKLEHRLAAAIDNMGAMCESLEHESHWVAERIRIEFNKVLKDKVDPPKKLKRLQRLNWVEQKRENNRLSIRFIRINQRLEVIKKTYDNICKAIKNYMMEKGLSNVSYSFLKL